VITHLWIKLTELIEFIGQWIFQLLTGLSGPAAYAGILLVLLACGLGVPIPEDITLLAAGFLSATGQISYWGAMIVGFVGVLAGDTFLFFLGRFKGRKAFSWPVFRKIFTPERVRKAEEKIQSNAKLICFMARFAPGLRAPVYLTAGVMKVSFPVFFLSDGFAALISVPVWVHIGRWFGDNIENGFEFAKRIHLYILIGLGIIIAVVLFKKFVLKPRKIASS